MKSVHVYTTRGQVPAVHDVKEIITQQYDDLEFVDGAGVTRRYVGFPYTIVTYPTDQQQLFGEK